PAVTVTAGVGAISGVPRPRRAGRKRSWPSGGRDVCTPARGAGETPALQGEGWAGRLRSRAVWLGYGVVIAALGYTLYLGLLVPALLAVATLWGAVAKWIRRPDLRGWLLGHGLAGLLLLPWLVAVLVVGSRPRLASIAQPGSMAYLEAAGSALTLGVLSDLGRVKLIVPALLALALAGFGLAWGCRRLRLAALAACLSLVVPVGGLYLLSRPNPVLHLPNLFLRYLVIFVPAYLLGIGWTLHWLVRRTAPVDDRLEPVPDGLALGGRSPTFRDARRLAATLLPAIVVVGILGTTGWTLRDYYQAAT
ncbi:MAG TPA: hypothetical protein VHL09_13100, partial [Dehalococcoidia bacterium]|nr:hypothetical protein [Dehalococcoidia bacterium]